MHEKNYHISYLLDFYGAALTEKQRDAIDLYYNCDLSLAEIAGQVGITRQGVRDAIKRGEDEMTQLETKLGFAAKFDEHMRAFEQIAAAADKIHGSRSSMNYLKIVDESVRDIGNAIASIAPKTNANE
ncbi:hypothetical protein FACS1894219_00710 [Clostridia bacterium]|nr:hypothetical protein FACS1894219_00710 [Clostridia bacterium]